MSRRANRAGFMVGAALCIGLLGCGGGGHRGAEQRRDRVCPAVELAHRRILDPAGTTFSDLVRDRTWSEDERAAAAAIAISATGLDVGRYEPLLDHLVERYIREVDEEERRGPPEASRSVRTLADRLDAELADGACG